MKYFCQPKDLRLPLMILARIFMIALSHSDSLTGIIYYCIILISTYFSVTFHKSVLYVSSHHVRLYTGCWHRDKGWAVESRAEGGAGMENAGKKTKQRRIWSKLLAIISSGGRWRVGIRVSGLVWMCHLQSPGSICWWEGTADTGWRQTLGGAC